MVEGYAVVVLWEPPLRWDGQSCTASDGNALTVELAPAKFNRQSHPDPTVERQVTARWDALLASKPPGSIWNATKFRFVGVSETRLTLHLGLTDYCEYQGTNLSAPRPLVDAGWEDPKYLAGAFGNACLVSTTDAQVAVLIRGGSVGEAVGKAVFPGGHAEPSKLGLDHIMPTGELPSQHLVVRELCESIIEEVGEELFLDRDHLAPHLEIIGITVRTADFKAQLVGRISCNLSSSQLHTNWTAKRSENSEGIRLLLLDSITLEQVLQTGRVEDIELMPEHYGALRLHLMD